MFNNHYLGNLERKMSFYHPGCDLFKVWLSGYSV